MVKYLFLEGLPGVGKTTIVKFLEQKNITGINVVHEIINPKIINKISHDQNDFMINDEMKYNKYEDGLIIIDRGFISTLSYNETLKIINNKHNICEINKWFDSVKDIYKNDNVYVFYLTTNGKSYQISENDMNGPYGSIESQIILDRITIDNIKKYCNNYKIIEYDKKNMEVLISEIVSEYLCS